MRKTFCVMSICALALGAGCSSDTMMSASSALSVGVANPTPVTAPSGSTIPVAFIVSEMNDDGTTSPATGKTVTVSVMAGGGMVNGHSSAIAISDDSGYVAVAWLVGPDLGTQTIRGAASSNEFLDLHTSATPQIQLSRQP